jgi:hypothetical protein
MGVRAVDFRFGVDDFDGLSCYVLHGRSFGHEAARRSGTPICSRTFPSRQRCQRMVADVVSRGRPSLPGCRCQVRRGGVMDARHVVDSSCAAVHEDCRVRVPGGRDGRSCRLGSSGLEEGVVVRAAVETRPLRGSAALATTVRCHEPTMRLVARIRRLIRRVRLAVDRLARRPRRGKDSSAVPPAAGFQTRQGPGVNFVIAHVQSPLERVTARPGDVDVSAGERAPT